ncbi:MAG: AAA family ATPase, partial [Myxococcales bacterium]|nr:AAA family ATPase [Myxococcales bacterium]
HADAAQLGAPKIALAAPTGKAAQRLSQAIRDGKVELEKHLVRGNDRDRWRATLDRVSDGAKTLHRLLGANPAIDGFTHGRNQPLGYDVVVVDEASMVDLALMRALLDSLHRDATLILVGDPDQLVSVSAGSVLADIVHVAERDPTGLGSVAGRLTHVWRAGSELAQVYDAARRGDRFELDQLLRDLECCKRYETS